MKIIRVGHTEIRVSAHNCYDCGGELDSDAHEAGEVSLSVAGIQRTPIQLWRCGECQEKSLVAVNYDAEDAALLSGSYLMQQGWKRWTPSRENRCPDHDTMMPCTLEHR